MPMEGTRIQLPPDLKAWAIRQAKEDNRSLSGYIRNLLDRDMRAREREVPEGVEHRARV